MIKKTHTRNQRRMYRIHKQEEQIEKDKTIIAEQQIELDKYKEVINKIKYNIEINVISMKNGKLLIELDVNEINDLLEEIE